VKKIQKFSSLKAGVAPVVLGLAMLSSPAFAQSAAEETAGEIVVTGSRIARPNVEAASPVTVVTAEAIQEFGATKIEDLTNSLPQVFAGQSSGVSNGADGTATIDLRGLGASRTVGAFAEYEINDSFKPYMDIMFMDYSLPRQAPSLAPVM
jgi:outer membrane receptor for ferrienterochelin and colicin